MSVNEADATDFAIPNPEQVFDTSLSPEADDFLTRSNIEFNEKQKALEDSWLSGHTRYDLYLDKGMLVITKPDTQIAFDIKFLGSARESDNSWEWAWSNPGVDPSMVFPKRAIATIAERFNLQYLKEGVVPLPNNVFPWYLGGIALKVTPDAVGIYSASAEGMTFYFVLSRPHVYLP